MEKTTQTTAGQGNELVRQCCACGLVLNGPEAGTRYLVALPGATHTYCPVCKAELLAKIDRRRAG